MRALWIEMTKLYIRQAWVSSRPVRALWIEMPHKRQKSPAGMSRPVRALWIEIYLLFYKSEDKTVEAREGLVD